MLSQDALATQYIRVPVAGSDTGVAINPSSDAVALAFPIAGGTPTVDDWTVGSWESEGDTYYARALVGPDGDVTLAPGLFDVWVRVSDTPETPVRRVGAVAIF